MGLIIVASQCLSRTIRNRRVAKHPMSIQYTNGEVLGGYQVYTEILSRTGIEPLHNCLLLSTFAFCSEEPR